MKTRWIVVWQGKRGKILARVINKGPLQEFRSFTRENYHADPEPGREARSPIDPSAPGQNTSFIANLAGELNAARKRGDFDELVLLADEAMLEALYSNLTTTTRKKVIARENIANVLQGEEDIKRQIARRW